MKELTHNDLFKEIIYFHMYIIYNSKFKEDKFLDYYLSTKITDFRLNVNYTNKQEYFYSIRTNLGNFSFNDLIFYLDKNNKPLNLYYHKLGVKNEIKNNNDKLKKEYKEIYDLFIEINKDNPYKIKEKFEKF